jgi:hypothetical protein
VYSTTHHVWIQERTPDTRYINTVKLSLPTSWRHKRCRSIDALILNRRAWWSTSRSDYFTSRKEPRYPISTRVSQPQSRSGRFGRCICAAYTNLFNAGTECCVWLISILPRMQEIRNMTPHSRAASGAKFVSFSDAEKGPNKGHCLLIQHLLQSVLASILPFEGDGTA